MDRFEILVGVKGGGSISGESGQQIKSELASIINQINSSNDLKLKLKVNPASLRQMRSVVRNSFKAPIPVRLTLDKGSLNAIKSQLRNIVSQGVVKTGNSKNVVTATAIASTSSNKVRNNILSTEKKAIQAKKESDKALIALTKAQYKSNSQNQIDFWENEAAKAESKFIEADKKAKKTERYQDKIEQEEEKTKQKIGNIEAKSQDDYIKQLNNLLDKKEKLSKRNLDLKNKNNSDIALMDNEAELDKVNKQIDDILKYDGNLNKNLSELNKIVNERNESIKNTLARRQEIYDQNNIDKNNKQDLKLKQDDKILQAEEKAVQARKDYNKAVVNLEKAKNKSNSQNQIDYWENQVKNTQKAKEEAEKNLETFKQSDDYKKKSTQEQIEQEKQLGLIKSKNQDTNEAKLNSLLDKKAKLEYSNLSLQKNGNNEIALRNNKQELAKINSQIENIVEKDSTLKDIVDKRRDSIKQEVEERKKLYKDKGYDYSNKSNKIIDELEDNKKVRRYESGTIDELRKEAQELATNGKTSAKEWDNFNKKLKETKKEFKDNGLLSKTLGTTLKENAAKFTRWFGISQGIMTLTRGVGMMWENVRNVDAAMTELKKVTDETNKTYDSFYENATSRARDLGASVSDTVNATADFARLGYNLKEAETTANAAIVYKNVGDGIEDIGTASDSIISTMKAFNIEATDAMSVVDKFNEVGNNYAISSKGIGDALLRSASALATGGNSLDESIGLITAMNEIVQDPDVVGTAVKTISLRLRNTSGQLQEMGEDAEGSFESITKLQQTIFKNSGVDIMLDSENFKSTTQILTELADAWKYMSDVQRASITKAVAGVHQANTFNAIMTNMSTAIEATNTSANSDGSALAENEKYLDSIGGKITKLKASFETFSTGFIDGGFAKGAITGLTGILDALTAIDNIFGTSTILASLITFGGDRLVKRYDENDNLFGVVKRLFIGGISNVTKKNIDADINALEKYKETLSDISKINPENTKKLMENMNFTRSGNVVLTMEGIATSTKNATEAMELMNDEINKHKEYLTKTKSTQGKFISGLKSIGKSVGSGLLAGFLLGVFEFAIGKLVKLIHSNTLEGKLEKADEARNVYKQTLQEIEDIDNEILSNKSRIDELNAKGSLTLVEDAELTKLKQANQQLEIQKQIKENLGTTQQREAAESSKKAVTTYLTYGKFNFDGTKYGRYAYNDPENGYSTTIMDSTIKAQKLLNEDTKNYNNLLQEQLDLTELINSPNTSKKQKWDAQFELKRVNKEIEEVSESIENHQAFIGENVNTLYDNYASFLDEDGNIIAGYEDVAAQVMEAIRIGSESIDSLDFAEKLSSSIEGVLSKENFAGLKDKLISAAQTGESELSSLIANTDGLQEALDSAGISAEEFTSYIMGIANAGDNLGNVENKIKQIREALSSEVQSDFDSFIAGKTDEEINAFYNYIKDNQIDMSTWTMEDFEWQWNLHVNVDGIESVETLTSALENAQNNYANLATAMSESVSGTGLSSDSIGSVKAMFSELEGYDASILFENTANGIHLNEEALEALNDQYEAKELERYEKSLNNLTEKYNEASKMLKQLSEGTDEYNAKKLEVDNLKAQIDDTQMLQSRFMGLTSAYNKFVIATQSGNERDSYETIAGNYEAMQDLVERGWYGDDSLEAYLDLLLNAKKRTGDAYKDFQQLSKTIEGTSYSIKDFWKFDSDGNLTTDGLSNFMQAINDTLGKEYAWKEADGSWSFDFSGKKIEEIADLFNMNTEAIQLFERALIDAGAKVKLDPLTASLDDLNAKAEQSKETLTSMGEETTDIEVKTDFSNISDSEEKLSSIEEELTFAKGLYDEISASDIDPDIKTAKLEYLIDQINVLLNLRNELAQPTYMELNTEDVDEGVADYLTNIQAYQTARANRQKVEYTGTSEEIQAAVKEEEKALQPILDMTDEQLLEIDIDVRGMDELERIETIKNAVNNDEVNFGIAGNLDYMLNRAEQGFDKLKEMGELSAEYEIDFNLSEVSDAQEQIDRVSKDFDKYRNEDGSWNLSIDGAEEAQQILAYLILQKQDVERPSVLNVDTSQASEEVQNAQQVLSNFIEASNEYEIAVAMGVNVEESKNNFIESFKTLNSLTGEGKEYVESMGITVGVDVSENSEEALGQAQTMKNTLLEKIKNLFGSGEGETVLAKYNVQATVDGSVNEGEVKTAKGEVTWTNKTDAVDAYSKKIQKAKGKVIWDDDETKVKKNFTANGTIKWSGGLGIFGNSNTGKPSKSGGSGGKKGGATVDGTANTVGLVDGTAFARGSWGTKSSGLALGGELGRELIVRNGRFFTIGDDGAEFFQYKRNDIIFNAEQTKQILEKGKITHGKRRGKALAEGNAFVEGNAFNTGSGFVSRKDYYTSSSNSNSSKNSNKNSNKSNTSKSNSSSDDSNKNGYEKERAALDHQYNMDYISKQEYYNKILALDKKYYSNTKKYQEEHWKIEEELYKLEQEIYEEKIENRQNEISLLEHQTEQLKRMKTDANADEVNAKIKTNRQKTIQEYKKIQEEAHATAQKYREMGYDENHELIQKCIDDWWDAEDDMADVFKEIADEAREAAEEALDLQEKAVSVAVDIIDEEIEKLEEKKKALEEANEEKEKEIELEELQQKLANARNQKNMRVYYADRGWVWESNQEDVKDAKKELDDYIKDQEIEAVEKDIEALEEYKDLISEIPDEYEKSVDRAEVLAEYGDDFAEKLLSGLNDTNKQFVNMLKNNYADAAKYTKALEKATDKSIADLEEFEDALMKCGYTAEEAAKIIMKAVLLAGSVDNLLGLDSEELADILNEATGEDGFTTITTHVGGRVNGDQIITEDSNRTFYYNQKNGNLMVVDKDTGATRIYTKNDSNYQVAIDSANASTGGMATKPPEDRKDVVDKNGNVIQSTPITGNKNNSSSGNSNSSNSGGSSSNNSNKIYATGNSDKQYGYNKDNGNIMVTRPDGSSSIYKPGDAGYNAAKETMKKDTGLQDSDLKKKTNTAAVGTTYAKQGLYNVDENGEELILHKPDKGRYTFLEKGDAVFTANVTQNLLKWASTTPPAFINKLSEHAKRINTPNVSVSTSTSSGDSIHIDKLTVVSQANDFEALIRDIKVKSKNR